MSWQLNIKSGKMINKERFWPIFKNYIAGLKDGEFILEYPREKKVTLSGQQRKYQFGCVYKILADHTEYTKDEIHQEMQKRFLSYEKDGKEFVISTAKLSTKEMEEYLENIRRVSEVEIPPPNEKANFYYDLPKEKP